MLASGRLSGSHKRWLRARNLGRAVAAAPVNGPAVWTVIVTVVSASPALICVGENDEQDAPVGSPEQVYVTLVLNVAEPTGEINIVVEAVCPGLAGGGDARGAGTLKS